MTGGNRIVAIGGSAEDAAPLIEATEAAVEAPTEAMAEDEWCEEAAPERAHRAWMMPALAIFAIAGWTAFFVWSNQWILAGTTPNQAITLVSAWSMPVLLIAVTWLIAMRSSSREATRFGDAARLLSDESARLEKRLTVVNRELSLAREFLAAQSRDLDALGRTAGEKISQHAATLQSLIQGNGEQVEAIASVSTTALDNMEKLRGQLPVIASSAKDVANNIGNAGRTAHTQLSDMVEGFNRLNEFGRASESHVESLRTRIDTTIEFLGTRLDDLHTRAKARFAEMDGQTQTLREGLATSESEALTALRNRFTDLHEETERLAESLRQQEAQSLEDLRNRLAEFRLQGTDIARTLADMATEAIDGHARSRESLAELDQSALASARERMASLEEQTRHFVLQIEQRQQDLTSEVETRQQQLLARQEEHGARVAELLATLDERIATRTARHEEHAKAIGSHADATAAGLDQATQRLAALAAEAGHAESALGSSLDVLSRHLAASREALDKAATDIGRLTDDSVRLLELLQASAEQGRDHLPASLASSEARLAEIERRIADLGRGVEAAALRGGEFAQVVASAQAALTNSLHGVSALQTQVESGAERHAEQYASLRGTLETLEADSNRIAEATQTELSASLSALSAATREALTVLEQSGLQTIESLTEKLGHDTAATVERVLRTRTAEAVGVLEEAAGHAAGTSREAALHLREQLGKIDELTSNLESRVARAREKAEDQVDNDFSRRVALITESLNSYSIDIAKALSSDVTDTAWASYLRGDRGVFTRRAVRLLETQEARSIAHIYGEDREFREHVSRYVHDFEAMLRQLLSTRDGHALSVTLLSSDMGKLYVALAQAIERLRS